MLPFVEIGSIRIPTYILLISLTYCFCLIWIVRRAERRNFSRDITLDISFAIMVGGFLGARIFHIIWEAPSYYWERPIGIFEVWRGGFVFFGGLLGALAATEWVFRRNKEVRGPWQDLFTPLFPLGYAIGRLSCLAAGCCYGRPTTLPWGIIFPAGLEATPHIPLHPTQIYAFLWEMCLFASIMILEFRRPRWLMAPGSLFFFWLMGHGVGRIMMEYYRADHRGANILGLSVSTVISLGLIVSSIIVLMKKQQEKNKQKNWTPSEGSSKL